MYLNTTSACVLLSLPAARWLLSLAAHAGLACACCVTAALLPYVTDLMAFVGALLTMTISLILPALMHMQLFKTDMPGWLLVFDCAVVLLGVACAYVGATSAMGSLQQKLAVAPAV